MSDTTVHKFDYYHLVPFRGRATMELDGTGRCNFVCETGESSGYHGEWYMDTSNRLNMRFHYAGEDANIRRHVIMHEISATNLIAVNNWPVTMAYKGMTSRPKPPSRPPPPATSLLPSISRRGVDVNRLNQLLAEFPEFADRLFDNPPMHGDASPRPIE